MENRKTKKMSGIKPNRTATNGRFVKHISRLLVLVMLLTSALAFSGCDLSGKYTREYYRNKGFPIMISLESKEMDINQMYIDFYMGCREVDYTFFEWLWRSTEKDESSSSIETGVEDKYKNEYLVFAVIYGQDKVDAVKNGDSILKNAIPLIKIPVNEAYSEYTYAKAPFFDLKHKYHYSRSNTIKIPKEYFINSYSKGEDNIIFVLCWVGDWETEKDLIKIEDIFIYGGPKYFWVNEYTVSFG